MEEHPDMQLIGVLSECLRNSPNTLLSNVEFGGDGHGGVECKFCYQGKPYIMGCALAMKTSDPPNLYLNHDLDA